MNPEKMRDYLIEIIRTDGICDDTQHYFTEEEIRKMSPYNLKRLYDLCYLNFGETVVRFDPAPEWEF